MKLGPCEQPLSFFAQKVSLVLIAFIFGIEVEFQGVLLPALYLFSCVHQVLACKSREYFEGVCLGEKDFLTKIFCCHLVLFSLFSITGVELFYGNHMTAPNVGVLQNRENKADSKGQYSFANCANLL